MHACIDHGKSHTVNGGYTTVRRAGKTYRFHRLVYALHNGMDICDLDGKVVMHTCDNRRCVNPAHLVLGTQRDNMLDMHMKGRANNPPRPSRKLDAGTVKEIRALYIPKVYGMRRLATRFGVDPKTISEVINGVSYKDV